MRRLYPLVLLLLPASAFATDEWMGLDDSAPILLALDLGRDEAGNDTQALGLLAPLTEVAGLQFAYGNTQLDDGEQQFDNRTLVSQIWYELNTLLEVDLQHFFEGNRDELELETLGLGLSLRRGNWRIRVHLERGELLIFTRDEVNDVLGRIPERIESDVDVLGLSLGSGAGPWYWQAGYRQFDYEIDLGRLERSDFAQFVVKASALAHSSLLISEEMTLLLGHADFDDDYSLYYARERSALDERYYDSLSFAWERWTRDDFGFLLGADYGAESEDLGLSLGLRWVL